MTEPDREDQGDEQQGGQDDDGDQNPVGRHEMTTCS